MYNHCYTVCVWPDTSQSLVRFRQKKTKTNNLIMVYNLNVKEQVFPMSETKAEHPAQYRSVSTKTWQHFDSEMENLPPCCPKWHCLPFRNQSESYKLNSVSVSWTKNIFNQSVFVAKNLTTLDSGVTVLTLCVPTIHSDCLPASPAQFKVCWMIIWREWFSEYSYESVTGVTV